MWMWIFKSEEIKTVGTKKQNTKKNPNKKQKFYQESKSFLARWPIKKKKKIHITHHVRYYTTQLDWRSTAEYHVGPVPVCWQPKSSPKVEVLKTSTCPTVSWWCCGLLMTEREFGNEHIILAAKSGKCKTVLNGYWLYSTETDQILRKINCKI